jgi:DNA relaxase NicK
MLHSFDARHQRGPLQATFNDEMKEIARQFAKLLRAIIESVDRFGLKARYLRKHQSAGERFYQTCWDMSTKPKLLLATGAR